MTDQQLPSPTEAAPLIPDVPEKEPGESRWHHFVRELTTGSIAISVLAVVLALVAGGFLIAVTDEDVQTAAGYFFARPTDTFRAIWDSVSGAYSALFQGAVYNFRRPGFAAGIRPLTETLTFATPLIAAGLGVALAFRVGMFNIGGRGQMLVGAAAAGWVGFALDLPWGVHLLLAVAAGVLAGGLWGGLAGLLKARTGAHEVITTIMLNFVAFYLVAFLLRTPVLQAPGSNNPKTPAMKETAVFPDLFGPGYNLHAGFLFAIAATVVVWWLLNRSSLGFQFRAVGENPHAARVAGINVKNVYVWAMLISGGLVGLAGTAQALGTIKTGFGSGIDAGIGFDAITVALLGRATPLGTVLAGLLFGALSSGGLAMQAAAGVPPELAQVLQALIVLFVAAPALIRGMTRIRRRRKQTDTEAEEVTA